MRTKRSVLLQQRVVDTSAGLCHRLRVVLTPGESAECAAPKFVSGLVALGTNVCDFDRRHDLSVSIIAIAGVDT